MYVCVKVFNEKAEDPETLKSFQAEVQAGNAGFAHPNVIKLISFGTDSIKINGQAVTDQLIYIVSELASNGEAFDYVQDSKGLDERLTR